MPTITNDQEFRRALEQLSLNDQRIAAGRFVQSVLDLCKESTVYRAVELAMDPDRAESEVEQALHSAKSHAVKTYTACGHDTDWLAQAEHFTAAAAAACLQAPENIKGGNPAWKAAMAARMARNCEMIETGGGEPANEAQQQYQILSEFLDSIR